MQSICSASVRLLLIPCVLFGLPVTSIAAAPKVHVVTLGAVRHVPYTQPDATPDTKSDETSTLKVRSLLVDDHQKEWTTGDSHDVTDRSFTIRRALRLNDALPGDSTAHWTWQPGPWWPIDGLA